MKRLRLFAALSVLTSAAFFPLLFPTPASAALPTYYTLGEYNAALSAAQLAVSNAQLVVTDKTQALETATAILSVKSQAVVDGATAVATAQSNYDTILIPQLTASGAGLTVSVYNNTTSRTPNEANLCKTDVVSQIAANWGGGSVMGCNSDRVTIHYYGTITVPNTGDYRFRNIADDGFYMTINGQPVISEWVDKGCNGAWGATIQLTAGTAYSIDAWFYENGGGACSTLYVLEPSGNWQVAPSAWFGQTTVTTMVKNPALLLILQNTQASYSTAVSEKEAALADVATATENLRLANVALQAAQDALAAIPPLSINAPSQLVATSDTSTVTLNWAAPTTNLIPERYAILWTDGTGGWGIATGNAGDATALNTFISIDKTIIGSTGGWDKNYTFKIRSDHDSGRMYSAWSNEAVLFITNPTPTPEPSTSPVPSPEPSPTQTPEAPTPSPSPTNTSPSPEPSTTPSPEPSVTPSPEPSVPPAPTPQPSPEPSPEPTPVPSPTPTPSPTPVEPTPVPSPEPTPVPSPEPGPSPSAEPTLPPVPVEPALPVDPQPEPSNPTPEPEPTPVSPEPTPTDPPIEEPEPPIEPLPPAVEPEEPPVEPVEPQEPSTPVEPEPTPPTLEPEPENPLEEPSQPPVEEPAPEPAPEPEPEPTTPAEEITAAVENALSDGKLSAADSAAILESLNADGEVTAEEVSALSEALSEDGKLTTAEKELVATALIESVAPGETLTKEQIQDAGIEYKDLPEQTPVEVRQDEDGNEVIITADVAAALVLLENPSELIGAIFSDPGEALQALGNIGADMSTEEREESTKAVVATVIAAGAAINAVGAAAGAAGGSTGGSTGGGGASGQSGYRRKP